MLNLKINFVKICPFIVKVCCIHRYIYLGLSYFHVSYMEMRFCADGLFVFAIPWCKLSCFSLSSFVFWDNEFFLVVILSSCFTFLRSVFMVVEFFLVILFLCSDGG